MCNKIVDLERADMNGKEGAKKSPSLADNVFDDDSAVDKHDFDDDSTGENGPSESTSKEVIAGEESFVVDLSKIFVLVVIIVVAFLVGYFTSNYLHAMQGEKFRVDVSSSRR